MPIVLPREPIPASLKSPRVLVLYGAPKVGKTTALAQLANCLTLDCEDGSDFNTMVKIKVPNEDHYSLICEQIVAEKRPYKYLAIDTVTALEEWMRRVATNDYKSSTLGKKFEGTDVCKDLPNGGGYGYLRDALQRYLGKAYFAAPRVIIMGHMRDKYIPSGDREGDAKVAATNPDFAVKLDTAAENTDLDLTGKCRQIVTSKADAIGYLFRDQKNQLCVSFVHKGTADGSRAQHLSGKMFVFDWNKIFID